jgi:hypothetical protein
VKAITVTAIALPILIIAFDIVGFVGGHSGQDIILPFTLFPAGLLPAGLALIASCILVVAAAIALFRRRFRRAGALALVLCFSWAVSPRFLPQSPFLLGFAMRLRQLSSPAEITSASQLCLSLMPSGGRVYGPKKIFGPSPEEEENSKPIWKALDGYRFVHLLDDTCVIFVEPPNVDFTWGGALPGHWGIRVLGSRDTIVVPRSVRFSDNIVLFRGE